MEEVEKINIVMVHPTQQAGFVPCNPYAIDVDRERNCYNCGGFGHLTWNYRPREENGVWEQLEYNKQFKGGEESNSS